jgi:hypothetical protein
MIEHKSEQKPSTIAVLHCNLDNTISWLKQNYEISSVSINRNMAVGTDGTLYVLVSNKDQILGWEFNSIIKAPSFYTLEDLARTRLR